MSREAGKLVQSESRAILPEEAGKLWAIWLGLRGLRATESAEGSLGKKILAEGGSYFFLCQPDAGKSCGGCCDDFRRLFSPSVSPSGGRGLIEIYFHLLDGPRWSPEGRN